MQLAFNCFPDKQQGIDIHMLCSMGVDSVSATHLLLKTKYRDDFMDDPVLHVLHFNHSQRPQNDVMAAKYREFRKDHCGYRNGLIPINLQSFIENATEDGLRKARIEYLSSFKTPSIFITAHHLDDATESYMMNVLRGKEGFLPIPFVTKIGNGVIVHPFLFTKKADFVRYAKRNDLNKYIVEDETNKIIKGSRRNFIRNEVIPLLNREQIGLQTIVRKKMEERLALELLKG